MKDNNKNDKTGFTFIVVPFIVHTIISLIFMILSVNNVGIFNEDTFEGLFISWITNGLITYCSAAIYDNR